MQKLWKIENNGSINQDALIQARTALLGILGKNELATFINKLGNDYETLSYVMDRMKQIFAMERYGKTLNEMWKPVAQK